MSGAARRIIYGTLSGAIGAACMTVIRMAARRRGLIDKTVSQRNHLPSSDLHRWLARVG